ncbi:hypothetical protein [Brucella intermedia]|uniref:hypothetical protein n=1 Tax=Brucella intermedia TaxID=94625 RepID=UPI00124DCB35|nr:hypothetical protein [Brucella intermedia]KAB2733593.1 hypothetical protein F9L02_01035 [Brucella intermedia]
MSFEELEAEKKANGLLAKFTLDQVGMAIDANDIYLVGVLMKKFERLIYDGEDINHKIMRLRVRGQDDDDGISVRPS